MDQKDIEKNDQSPPAEVNVLADLSSAIKKESGDDQPQNQSQESDAKALGVTGFSQHTQNRIGASTPEV